MTEKEICANELAAFYIKQTNHQHVPIKIHFVDNINDDWIFYTSDDNVIRQYLNQDFTKYNGLTMPYDGETYHLLIRNDYEDYECTVIHECTHAFDYDRFRVDFNNGNLNIECHNKYTAMALYSEFHARTVAHSYLLNKITRENILNIITNEFNEMCKEISKLKIDFLNKTISYQWFSYMLMQFVGRLHSYNIYCNTAKLIEEFFKKLLRVYHSLCALDQVWSNEKFSSLTEAIEEFALSK